MRRVTILLALATLVAVLAAPVVADLPVAGKAVVVFPWEGEPMVGALAGIQVAKIKGTAINLNALAYGKPDAPGLGITLAVDATLVDITKWLCVSAEILPARYGWVGANLGIGLPQSGGQTLALAPLKATDNSTILRIPERAGWTGNVGMNGAYLRYEIPLG